MRNEDIVFNVIETLVIERLKQRLSTKDLSQKAKVELRTIQRIEAHEGDAKFINIVKMANALGFQIIAVKPENKAIKKNG